MTIQTPPATFHCVFFFDSAAEDFMLHALYSRAEDAAACKALMHEAAQKQMTVVEWTLDAIKHHLLDQAIEQASKLIRAGVVQPHSVPDKAPAQQPTPQSPDLGPGCAVAPAMGPRTLFSHPLPWPILGVRVDGSSVVVSMKGSKAEANNEARQLCGDILAALEASKCTPAGAPATVEEPKDYTEYLERFMLNNKITGYGAGTTMHIPCPFCAAPDFAVLKIADAAKDREDTCNACGRSAAIIAVKDEANTMTHIKQFQTRGPDQPAWLNPKMPRAVADQKIPLPHEVSKAHDGDMQAASFGTTHYTPASTTNKGHPYRACSYCGSAHPADIAAGLRAKEITLQLADMKYGWPHKAYVAGPNPHKYIKFYSLHLLDATPEDRAVIEQALGIKFEFSGQGPSRNVSWVNWDKRDLH